MANPLVKIVVPLAAVVAGQVGNKVATSGWGAVFGEDAPTVKAAKASQKETRQRRKEAKKEGRSKAEVESIRDPVDELPIWKTLLWALVSGVLLQGLKMIARRGAAAGAERVTARRPRANRG